ncbi:MAG TPA: anti-sigma factor [Candidatus Angelobacter sp.]
MKDHSQYAEMLALYAVGALAKAEECSELEAHLRSCAECRSDLAALRGDAALLALSAVGPSPPQGARQRLLAAIANEPRKRRAGQRVVIGVLRPGWLRFAPVAAALLLAVFSLLMLRSNSRLQTKLDQAQGQITDLNKKLQQAQEVAELLGPNSMHVTLVATTEPRRPQVKTFYSSKMGRLMLVAGNMEPLPPDKAYELWLLPANGGAPMPAGTFKPSAKGDFVMHHWMTQPGIEASGFAITVEPASGSAAPTLPIEFSGTG